MKVYEVMERVTETRGQQYDQRIMIDWLNEIESQIAEDIYKEEFEPIEELQTELRAPIRFKDIYVYYLYAKIDYNNQEIEKYNNDVMMYNSMLQEYETWHTRKTPGQTIMFSKF